MVFHRRRTDADTSQCSSLLDSLYVSTFDGGFEVEFLLHKFGDNTDSCTVLEKQLFYALVTNELLACRVWNIVHCIHSVDNENLGILKKDLNRFISFEYILEMSANNIIFCIALCN